MSGILQSFRAQYYVPDAVLQRDGWPRHLPHAKRHATRLLDGMGPDGTQGLVAPGSLAEDRGAWHRTQAGWYVRDLPEDPGELLRLTAHQQGCEEVPTDRGPTWLVTRLLTPEGYCAVDMPYGVLPDGSYGLIEPPWAAPAIDRARCYRRWIASLTPERLQDPAVAAAALDDLMQHAAAFLELTYHLSIHELAIRGWLDRPAAQAICEAATGTDPLQLEQARRSMEGDGR